ncbi:MAG TPA: hypothetical protein PKM63_11735 [Panacibacter sp.]|nr:hypothetical protein [Panacibacter sp.]HNP44950.1 hypothetical protein [Panacibacter sp.]
MKTIAIPLPVVVLILSAFLFPANKINNTKGNAYAIGDIAKKKQLFSIGCAVNIGAIDFNDEENDIPLLGGWGNYRMPVTVSNDSSRIYFEQGINMYYGFHIIEAIASFQKAIKFDTGFAMGYWGKALAYGPNINDLGYSASPDALVAVEKAKSLYYNCSGVEKALVNAIAVRYSADTMQSRGKLNQLYANAMKSVHEQYPESADAASLYADALMVQHPWDLYDNRGKPKPWTPAIVNVLEGLVKEFPNHPGANHYYIHTIEGSDHPQDGIVVADRLGKFMPGVAHLVHMPSHIYIRSGYYDKGIEVNKEAVASYNNYLSQFPAVKNADYLYIVHNLHMEATCANMDARYADAVQISNECHNSFDSSYLDAGGYFGAYAQYIFMTPYLTMIRFGHWNDILNGPAQPKSHVYANLLWHYARGVAFARKELPDAAKSELDSMLQDMNDIQLQESPPAFNAPVKVAAVAESILEGLIAEEKNDIVTAINAYKDAVRQEDNLLYNEPRDWVHPARQYLGDALTKAGRFREAETVFRDDLKINPNNPWSLTGLQTVLLLENKKNDGLAVQEKLREALKRSDTKISNAVF